MAEQNDTTSEEQSKPAEGGATAQGDGDSGAASEATSSEEKPE